MYKGANVRACMYGAHVVYGAKGVFLDISAKTIIAKTKSSVEMVGSEGSWRQECDVC